MEQWLTKVQSFNGSRCQSFPEKWSERDQDSPETDLAGCPGQQEDNSCQNKARLSALSSTSTSGGINYGFGVCAVIDQIRLARGGPRKTQSGCGGWGPRGAWETKQSRNSQQNIRRHPSHFIPLLPPRYFVWNKTPLIAQRDAERSWIIQPLPDGRPFTTARPLIRLLARPRPTGHIPLPHCSSAGRHASKHTFTLNSAVMLNLFMSIPPASSPRAPVQCPIMHIMRTGRIITAARK